MSRSGSSRRWWSCCRPSWLTLLVEGPWALLRIVGAHDSLAERLGEDLRLVQGEVEALADGEPGTADGERCVAVHEGGDLAGAVEQAVVLHDLGDEAELERPLRAEPFVTP